MCMTSAYTGGLRRETISTDNKTTALNPRKNGFSACAQCVFSQFMEVRARQG